MKKGIEPLVALEEGTGGNEPWDSSEGHGKMIREHGNVPYRSWCTVPQQVYRTTAGVLYHSWCTVPQLVFRTTAGVPDHSRYTVPQLVYRATAGVPCHSWCTALQLVTHVERKGHFFPRYCSIYTDIS